MSFEQKGRESQHSTTTFQIVAKNATRELSTTTKVEYKISRKKKPTRNSKGKIDGYTIGEEETNGSMGIRRTEWLSVKQWLKQQFPDTPVQEMELKLLSQYQGKNDDLDGQDEVNFMFDEEGFASENNQEVHNLDMPLFVWAIDWEEGE